MNAFDPRLTPARPDLAAAHLRGRIEAADYAVGRPVQIRQGVVDLRRAPNFEVVRRTPLATARTRPCSRVNNVMMRSASPSFWVRSTTPSSR